MNHPHNALLGRKEVIISLESPSTPAMSHATKAIAEECKVVEEVVAVKRIHNSYGSSTFMIHAFVYDSPEMKVKIEPRKKDKKAKGAN